MHAKEFCTNLLKKHGNDHKRTVTPKLYLLRPAASAKENLKRRWKNDEHKMNRGVRSTSCWPGIAPVFSLVQPHGFDDPKVYKNDHCILCEKGKEKRYQLPKPCLLSKTSELRPLRRHARAGF